MSDDAPHLTARRRTVLGSLAGLGLLGSLPRKGTGSNGDDRPASGIESYHPGQPLVVTVGEQLFNSAFVGPELIGPRENLAPGIPDPGRNPTTYDADEFAWSISRQPADSTAEVTFATPLFPDRSRYDEGRKNVAEFEADVPGTYRLELAAPDGVHELTIRAFPEPAASSGGPPRLDLTGSYDDGTFHIEANPSLAPDSTASVADLVVEYLPDDRDALSSEDIEMAEGGRHARVHEAALDGEPTRLHAVAYDGDRHSVLDTITLDPEGSVASPNRAPTWLNEGVMYQIFTRSWAGERFGTDFDVLAIGDDELGARGVEYLAELGVDVVWLTPVVPAVSASRQHDGDLVGGGPHGYDTTDYFDIAPDLAPEGVEPLDAYRAFIDACHDHDIKVVFDLVINHCGRSMDLFQDTIESQADDVDYWPRIHEWNTASPSFDWFARLEEPREASPGNRHYEEGEVIEPTPRPTGFWGLQVMPNFNFDNVAVREYMLTVADFWSGSIGVDGFRCDIAWGVPHSLWRDIREIVRANDSEFLLLDETIPNDPKMAENQFDMHFDTDGFTRLAHAVARGEAAGADLLEPIFARTSEGFPDHSLFLNAVENHDEPRTLIEARDGSRSDPLRAQRAVWAAGVLLPGVPHVYYGQERAISLYGDGRHRGAGDHRGGDVREGGKQRAFMNWDEFDASHLAFYRNLIGTYHDLDVLKPDAAMRRAWYTTTGDVLGFARETKDLPGTTGPEKVIVLVNFEDGPATVYLRPGVDSMDLFTGEDIETDAMTDALAVAVDEVAILQTPSILSIGERVAELAVETGTDDGPGGYVYPTDEAYVDGAFDIAGFSVHERPDTYQFRLAIDGSLENPWDLQHGFSVQHVQIYVHTPDAESGSTVTREGVNADLGRPHQSRLVVDGANGARLESDEGEVLATGDVRMNPITDAIIVEVSKRALDVELEDVWLAPMLLGFDADTAGQVTPVAAEAGAHVFGGGRDDDRNPNVIDLVVPFDVSRDDALAFEETDPATVPFTELVTPFAELATFSVETDVGYGPGTYEYPTGEDYYAGAWDLAEFTIEQSRDRVKFVFTMREPIENTWDLPFGFSHQFFQIYVHDPAGDGPTSTTGREGTNVAFEIPYHTRVVANGERDQGVENADGDGVSRDVGIEVEGRSVRVDVPRQTIGWFPDEEGVAIAPLVCPFDGFGEGHLRAIEAEPAEHVIGGGHDEPIDPKVMDMVTPEGVDRATVLGDYDDENPTRLPFVTLGELSRDDLPVEPEESEADPAEDAESDEQEPSPNEEDDEGPSDDGMPGFGIGAAAAGTLTAALLADRLTERAEPEE